MSTCPCPCVCCPLTTRPCPGWAACTDKGDRRLLAKHKQAGTKAKQSRSPVKGALPLHPSSSKPELSSSAAMRACCMQNTCTCVNTQVHSMQYLISSSNTRYQRAAHVRVLQGCPCECKTPHNHCSAQAHPRASSEPPSLQAAEVLAATQAFQHDDETTWCKPPSATCRCPGAHKGQNLLQ
jgi:hypothetical protein